MSEQLAMLKKRLGLTDAQTESAGQMLLEKMGNSDFTLKALGLSEQGTADQKGSEKEMLQAMLDPWKQEKELDAKLLGILTPAQQAAYAAHQQEQRANKVEIATNKELAKLQGAMSLSSEQKDQLFSTLTQFADHEHDQPIPGMIAMIEKRPAELDRIKRVEGEETANQLLGLVEELKQRHAQRRAAFQSILSDEQMKVYENLQQSSAFDMSEMMGELMGMDME